MLLGLESTPSPQVQQIAQAIAYAEGYYAPGSPGTVNAPSVAPVRNNNPCDLGGASRSYPSIDAGWDACYGQVNAIENNTSAYYNSGMSISQIAAIYAPASAGNVPANWASIVASQLGLSPSDPLTAVGSSGTNSPAPGGYLPAQNQIDLSTGLDSSGIDNSPVSSGISLLDSSGSLTGWGWGAIAAAFGLLVLAEMG